MIEILEALTADERRDLIAREAADEVDSGGWQGFRLGTPLLEDLLEEGLAVLDITCVDSEAGRA